MASGETNRGSSSVLSITSIEALSFLNCGDYEVYSRSGSSIRRPPPSVRHSMTMIACPGKTRSSDSQSPEYQSINAMQLVRSDEHTSELQSLMRISYAVFCVKKKNTRHNKTTH